MAAHRRRLKLALRSSIFDVVLLTVSQQRDATVLQSFGGRDDRLRAGDSGAGSFTVAQRTRG
jgi:hypothetical protein